jgi:trans-aconitate 2-methyltransferase
VAPAGRWDARLYLRFEEERTQPTRDLVQRVELQRPRQIVDLGCGPGNSTAVLRARWPHAACTGVDSSAEMLEVARRSDRHVAWRQGDIRTWRPRAPVDLVFSNAALQWVPDHTRLLPRLFGLVRRDGALAAQMPANSDEPYQLAARRLQRRPAWRRYPRALSIGQDVAPPAAYFDLLARRASRVVLWDTRYVHVLPGPAAVVAWTAGTGLRPWLAGLPDDRTRRRFLAEYRTEIGRVYPRRTGGAVLFPFLRRFLVAYR